MPGQFAEDGWTNGATSVPEGGTGTTRVCAGKPTPGEPQVKKATITEALYHGRRNLESVIGRDDRLQVDDEDIMPDGKYRGECSVAIESLWTTDQSSVMQPLSSCFSTSRDMMRTSLPWQQDGLFATTWL